MALPLYELTLSEDSKGLQAIAFVEEPAIGLTYQAFSDHKKEDIAEAYKFKVIDEEKRIAVGPAMIPNLPIYRNDDDKGEYQVVFRKETIAQLVEKFAREKNTDKFNKNHDGQIIEGVFIRDSFITDEQVGIKPPTGFENVADGTWFISAKIENDEMWKDVKENGTFKGFSIEGYFSEKLLFDKMTDKKTLSDEIKAGFDSLAKGLKNWFADDTEPPVQVQAGTSALADGREIKWEGDLMEGTAVMLVTPEGEMSVEDGEWELEDGRIIITKGGMVAQIMDAPAEDVFDEERVRGLIESMLEGFKADFVKELEGKFATESGLSEKLEKATEKIAEQFEKSTTMLIDALDTEKPATPVKSIVPEDKEVKMEKWKNYLRNTKKQA